MRFRPLAIVVLVAFALTTVAGPVGARSGGAAERRLLDRLAPGASVSRDRTTGDITAIRGGRRAIAPARTLGDPATPTAAARVFLDRFGELVGVTAPGRQLRVARVDRTGRTGTFVRYQQEQDGVPVLGGELVVVVDRAMGVRAVRGEVTRDQVVTARPRVSPGTAMRTAREAVARATGLPADRLRASAPTRWIFDPRLLDAPGLPYARLVWRMDVTDGTRSIDWFVAVDAESGAVALRFDQRPSGAPVTAVQRICDQKNKRETTLDLVPCGAAGALAKPYVLDEAKHAEAATQAAHEFYRLRFGYDLAASLGTATGGRLVSTIRYCPSSAGGSCPYPNAFWDGTQMVYGDGFAGADDVVGHELTHGVTERASNLFYYMQSGAINEALSDIFGESVDLTYDFSFDTDAESARWKMGEDVPSLGVIRNMKDPTLLGDPDRVDSPLWDDDPDETDQGGVHSNSGVANKAFYLMVEGSFPMDPDRDVALDQALAIWFLASQQLLTTGSDYNDLGNALLIACDQLLGVAGAVKDKNGTASTDIEANDCGPDGHVRFALSQTRMRWDDGRAQDAQAPVCTNTDTQPTYLLADPIDESGTGWTFDTAGDRRWYTQDAYALPDPDAPATHPWALWGQDLGRTADRRIRRTNAVAIPTSGPPVFLWVRHAYGFDDGSEDVDPNNRAYDGGVIEVSANGGPWTDISRLFVAGAPTRRIFTGDTNPLKGRLAYGAESGGYVTARALLTGVHGLSFAGKNLKLSFRIGTDSTYGGEGWFVDDVRIYQCPGTDHSNPPSVGPIEIDAQGGSLTADGRVAVGLRSNAGGGTWPVVLTTSVATGAGPFTPVGGGFPSGFMTFVPGLLPTGSAVQHVRITATDENGDTASQTLDAHATLLQEAAMTYTGTWSTRSVAGSSGGKVRVSTKPGSSARIATTTEDVAIIGRMGPDMGKVRMCFSDTSCSIKNLYAPTAKPRQVIAVLSGPDAGTASIKVILLSTKDSRSSGRKVEIDAVVRIGE